MDKFINKFFISILLSLTMVGYVFATENIINENILSEQPIPEKKIISEDFQKKTVRILISNAGSFEYQNIIISAEDEFFITSGNDLIAKSSIPITITNDYNFFIVNTNGELKKIDKNKKLIISTSKGPIEIKNITKKGQNARYLGQLEISQSQKNNLRIINIIDIENYIRGVVPNEMPISFGLEALKAQAIAARGYVYRDKTLKNADYDVCDTTSSQVYNGYNSYSTISDKAAEETKGQFAIYDNKIILSLYFSTAGGYTENYENVFSQNGITTKFPAEPIPYLKGIADFEQEEDLSKEENFKKFYSQKQEHSYEINSPKYRWTYQWNINELEKIIAQNLIKYASSPFIKPSLNNISEFGHLQNIEVLKRGVSGKAMYIKITTDKNNFLVARELMIRRILTYNNKWLPSANIFFEKLFNNDKLIGIKVIGGGYGHGVGMSQYGASGMAKKGFTYDEILKHYYSDISIGSYPVICDLNEMKNCKATFYSPNKKTYLILDFPEKAHNLTFKINDSKILVSADDFQKKKGKVNLKKWMNKGINSIELIDYQKGLFNFNPKSLTFYVELNENEK